MPENQSDLGAPAPWDRLRAVADALGTSPGRVLVGVLVGVVLAGALAWTLVATPGGGVPDEALPRATAPSTTASSAAGGGAAGRVFVYVTGAVVSPGVYRLGAEARVADAVDAAGGPAPDADLVPLNLAATVSDGERVYVPKRGEVPPESLAAGAVGGGGGVGAAGPVNLNTATAEQLDSLPGVGPATAQAIVAWRERHGRFKRVDDLLNVRGIGPAKLEALRSEVRV